MKGNELDAVDTVISGLNSALQEHGFRFKSKAQLPQKLNAYAIWIRRTWNTNRAVALLNFSMREAEPKLFIQNIKWRLLAHIGFFPVLYPLGLQLILLGSDYLTTFKSDKGFVDKIDNQIVIVQSVFFIDDAHKKYFSERTWGQIFTQKFQEIISDQLKQSYQYYDGF